MNEFIVDAGLARVVKAMEREKEDVMKMGEHPAVGLRLFKHSAANIDKQIGRYENLISKLLLRQEKYIHFI